jgi:hypothetical protein
MEESIEHVVAGGGVLEVGKTYEVRNQRKGTFTGRITKIAGEWVSIKITSGVAKAVIRYNVRDVGEEVTVRSAHTIFVPAQEEEPRVRPVHGGLRTDMNLKPWMVYVDGELLRVRGAGCARRFGSEEAARRAGDKAVAAAAVLPACSCSGPGKSDDPCPEHEA